MSGGVGKMIDGDRPRHFTKPRTLPQGLLARPQVPAYNYPSEWARLVEKAKR